MQGKPEKQQRRSRFGPPPDSDLIGIPLVVGIVLALLAISAGFIFLGWVGMVVLVVVLIAALAISYLVVTGSEDQG
jgi:hypothetical protein